MKHTPGPWKVNEERCLVYVEGKEADICIADTQNGHTNCLTSPVKALANAHLIAAAPELLEALNETLETLRIYSYSAYLDAQKARAAIAKATKED